MTNHYHIMNKHFMPSHWKWLLSKEISDLTPPDENRATCSQCPSDLNGYHHKARCCTYRPQLANFLIGSAIQNRDISEKKFNKLFHLGTFLPLASLTTPQAMKSMNEPHNEVCHYWKQGTGCTIHKFRNHTCSTFFCFTLAGPQHSFWSDLAEYVMMLENNLSWWLISQLGFDPTIFLKKLDSLDKNTENKNTWSSESLEYIWEKWTGKEVEFFLECAQLIERHKESLYETALTYQEHTTLEFQELLMTYPPYPENTHLPSSQQAILACETKVLSAMKTLYSHQNSAYQDLKFNENSSLQHPDDVLFLHKNYPEAIGFLILKNTNGNPIDFQPLTHSELKILQNIQNANLLPEGVSKKSSMLIEGLKLRGFFTV